jgi:hypothetical protein
MSKQHLRSNRLVENRLIAMSIEPLRVKGHFSFLQSKSMIWFGQVGARSVAEREIGYERMPEADSFNVRVILYSTIKRKFS